MRDLIFATGNPSKFQQMAYVIRHLGAPLTLISAQERYGEEAAYEERGRTAAAIALNGAQALAKRLEVPMVVEDTTFHIDALGGWPGIHAGQALKEHGLTGILEKLEGEQNRRATITSAVAWAAPGGNAQTWVRSLSGQITDQESWAPGLPDWVAPTPENPTGGGYNAIFQPDGSVMTLAQVLPEDAVQMGYREPNFCAVIAFLLSRESA